MLLKKIKERTCSIGIVGLGYVGLPLALRFFEEGFTVFGFDIDKRKIDALCKGESYINHIPHEAIAKTVGSKNISFISDPTFFSLIDIIILCVPTPLTRNKEPDLKPILSAMDTLYPYFREDQLIILESTVYPGTTDEILKPILESKSGLTVGSSIFLAFSPEREDPGNQKFNTKNTPKVVGGCTPSCLNLANELYEAVIDTVICVNTAKIAEMTKILENTYRLVNISFINEMKMVCEKMGMDIFEVIEAASSKPFGFTPFYPSGGVGGHCLPLDPFYFRFKAREFNVPTRFIELAGEVNNAMPEYVVSRIMEALNTHALPLKNSKILILGVAYKKNIDDPRESAAIEIVDLLAKKGASVRYCDPYIGQFEGMKSLELTEDRVKSHDCVVIITDHDDFDYKLVRRHAPLIVDTRGRYTPDGKSVFRA